MTTGIMGAPAQALILDTIEVGMDEPALQLVERDLPRPDAKGISRFLNIIVMRGDRPYRYRRELGPVHLFADRSCFQVFGGGREPNGKYWSVHTVGQLLDIWEARLSGKLDPPELPDGPDDLLVRFTEELDERQRSRRKQSSFSPLVKLQRD